MFKLLIFNLKGALPIAYYIIKQTVPKASTQVKLVYGKYDVIKLYERFLFLAQGLLKDLAVLVNTATSVCMHE